MTKKTNHHKIERRLWVQSHGHGVGVGGDGGRRRGSAAAPLGGWDVGDIVIYLGDGILKINGGVTSFI